MKVNDAAQFPNTALYTHIIKWLRAHTDPVTFMYQGKKLSTSLRLSKSSFSWINTYEPLQKKELSIHVY